MRWMVRRGRTSAPPLARPLSRTRACTLAIALDVSMACLLALAGGAAPAHAQTDEIQVYDGQLAPPGEVELTWHNNWTASGRAQSPYPGGIAPEHALNGVPELALGVAPGVELGSYAPIYTLEPGGRLRFDALKLRALFARDAGADLRVGVNFELSRNEPAWDRRRWTGEIRPILAWHRGAWGLLFNPILDTAFDGPGRLDFAPATRLDRRFSERFVLGLEHYGDFGELRHLHAGAASAQQLFAVLDVGSPERGAEFGVGRGFTAATDRWVLKLMWIQRLR